MGLLDGLPSLNRRTARTLSLPLIALLVAILAGPTAAATAVHPATPLAPMASHGIASAHVGLAAGMRPTAMGTPLSAAVQAELHGNGQLPAWVTAQHRGPASAPLVSHAQVQTKLQAAEQSLSTGAGPAFGAPTTCTSAGAGSARCAPTSAGGHPAVAPAYEWQNASLGDSFLGSPPEGQWASMAYDAYDGIVVYFGGCDYKACPDGQTWGFLGWVWENLTNYSATPPPSDFSSMTYDAHFGLIILYGGCSLYVCPDNYTYSFTAAGGWFNDSAFLTNAGTISDGMMAYIPGNNTVDNYTVLFGGCTTTFCTPISNLTWGLSSTGWVNIPTSPAPPPEALAGFAWDPNFGALIMFGGCTLSACAGNQTWAYYNGLWTNETSFLAFWGPTPPGRGYQVMTYDELDGELVMYGGESTTILNDTWTMNCFFGICAWTNWTGLGVGNHIAGLAGADAPSQSNRSIGTQLFGGEFLVGGYAYSSNGTYVWEPPLAIAPTVPSTGTARSAWTVSANPSGGSSNAYPGQYGAIWFYTAGGPSYGVNSTLNFTHPGAFTVTLHVYDYFGVTANQTFSVTATGPTTGITGAAVTDAGHGLALAAVVATGGNAPYNYSWAFGDGSHGYGTAVTHSWATAGPYTVTLTANDSTGLMYNATQSVTVHAAPSVTATASHLTVDAKQSTSFTSTLTGGTGPFTYSWDYTDTSTNGANATPVHIFNTAGTYKVHLTVTDALGVVAQTNVTVTVNAALAATVTTSAATVTTGTSVTFTATQTGGTAPYTYAWVFGDGHTATGASVTHSYATAGTYTARVWVNDSTGGGSVIMVAETVTNAGSTGSSSSNGPGGVSTTIWIVVAVIAILAIIGAVVMMMRRKPKGGDSSPPSGATTGPSPPPGAGGSS